MATHLEIIKVLKILKAREGKTMLGEFSKKKYSAYRILIGTILSARAKDEVTEPVTDALFKKYPTSHSLAKAKPKDVQKVIKRIGFYREKAKSIMSTAKDICTKYDDKVPNNLEELMKLRGVGRKVANCVLVYAFGKDAIPVDIHVFRISNRLGWVKTKSPEETEKKLIELVPKKCWQDVNDTLVAHGKTICTPVSPFCSKCPVYNHCKRRGVTKHR